MNSAKCLQNPDYDEGAKRLNQRISRLTFIVYMLAVLIAVLAAGAVAAQFLISDQRCCGSSAIVPQEQHITGPDQAASTTRLLQPDNCCIMLKNKTQYLEKQDDFQRDEIRKLQDMIEDLRAAISLMEEQVTLDTRKVLLHQTEQFAEDKTDGVRNAVPQHFTTPGEDVETDDIWIIGDGSGIGPIDGRYDDDSEISGEESPFVDDEHYYEDPQNYEGSGSGFISKEHPGSGCLRLAPPVCPTECIAERIDSRGCSVQVCCTR